MTSRRAWLRGGRGVVPAVLLSSCLTSVGDVVPPPGDAAADSGTGGAADSGTGGAAGLDAGGEGGTTITGGVGGSPSTGGVAGSAGTLPGGNGGVAGVGGSTPTCSTQSFDAQCTATDDTIVVRPTETNGQSFVAGVSKEMYSISFLVADYTNEGSVLTIRIDNDLDMEVEYLVEITCDVPAQGWFECVIPSSLRPSLQAGQTYYVFLHGDGLMFFQSSRLDGYPDGGWYWHESRVWSDLSTVAIFDFNFKIGVCD